MSRHENQNKKRKKWRYSYRKFGIAQRFGKIINPISPVVVSNSFKVNFQSGYSEDLRDVNCVNL